MSHPQLINHLIQSSLEQYGMLEQVNNKKEQEDLMPTQKMRVAVLMGGTSNEKEISLESGRNIVYKLSSEKYTVLPLFLNKDSELYHITQRLLVRSSTAEIEQLIEPSSRVAWGRLPEIADFVFIALHGGQGENGCVQGTLEMLGLAYNGSGVLTSALCMDKFKTNVFLKNKGFNVPGHILIAKHEWQLDQVMMAKKITEQIPFPLIVKPHDDGCSVMVQKISSEQQLLQALSCIFENNKEHALVEEYIVGMELTVGVIGNARAHALPPSQTITTKDVLSIQEKFLPGAGENQTPAPLPSAAIALVQRTMEAVYETLGCKGYARIDCFYQNAQQSKTGTERVVILEINTLPGMTPATCIFHQAAEIGIKPREFIDVIIALGQQAAGRNAEGISVGPLFNDLVKDKQPEQS